MANYRSQCSDLKARCYVDVNQHAQKRRRRRRILFGSNISNEHFSARPSVSTAAMREVTGPLFYLETWIHADKRQDSAALFSHDTMIWSHFSSDVFWDSTVNSLMRRVDASQQHSTAAYERLAGSLHVIHLVAHKLTFMCQNTALRKASSMTKIKNVPEKLSGPTRSANCFF